MIIHNYHNHIAMSIRNTTFMIKRNQTDLLIDHINIQLRSANYKWNPAPLRKHKSVTLYNESCIFRKQFDSYQTSSSLILKRSANVNGCTLNRIGIYLTVLRFSYNKDYIFNILKSAIYASYATLVPNRVWHDYTASLINITLVSITEYGTPLPS